MRSRRIPTAFSLAVAAIVALGAGASPALAGEAHPFLREFGHNVTEAFCEPERDRGRRIHRRRVRRRHRHRHGVQVRREWQPCRLLLARAQRRDRAAHAAASFSFPNVPGSPAAIAVDNACVQHAPALTGKACEEFDPSAGDLYVMDSGHGVIDKFSAEGKYLGQIGGFTLHRLAWRTAGARRRRERQRAGRPEHTDRLSRLLLIDEFDDAAENIFSLARIWDIGATRSLAVGILGEPQAHGFAVSATGDIPVYEPSCSCTAKVGQKLSRLGRVGRATKRAMSRSPSIPPPATSTRMISPPWPSGTRAR